MTEKSTHDRIVQLMNDEVQHDKQGPAEHQFEIYDDGDFVVVKEGDDWKVLELAGVDEQGHQGQPNTLLEGGDEDEVLEILRSEGGGNE